jgi:hypothetical protein
MTPSEFLRLLLDPIRLAVAGDAAAGGSDPEVLANRLGVDQRAVAEARGKLLASGLLTAEGLNAALMRDVARLLPSMPPADESVVDGPWTAEEVDTLGRFFSGDRLTSIPANLSKRRVVLERLAQEFEPGLRYEQADVNFRLQLFHADYASLRRYLVDEGMMSRADGVYWRTGGRHLDEPPPEPTVDND